MKSDVCTVLATIISLQVSGCISRPIRTTEAGSYVGMRSFSGLRKYIENGGDPNITTVVGDKHPILWGAAINGYYEIVEYLISVGANPNWKDQRGLTVYDVMLSEKWRNQEPDSDDQRTITILKHYPPK